MRCRKILESKRCWLSVPALSSSVRLPSLTTAGTQACRALKAEGIETVLVNSNPATIMTDPDIADHVYIEPLTAGSCRSALLKRKSRTAILPTLGGQTGLNLSMELATQRLSGPQRRAACWAASRDTIDTCRGPPAVQGYHGKASDQPCIPSKVVENLDPTRMAFADEIGYPVIVRPAFTMGGTGGGICENRGEAARDREPTACVFRPSIRSWWKSASPAGRRSNSRSCGTARATSSPCANMENLDPVGVHTGDSIVVAPSHDSVRQGIPDAAHRRAGYHHRAGH